MRSRGGRTAEDEFGLISNRILELEANVARRLAEESGSEKNVNHSINHGHRGGAEEEGDDGDEVIIAEFMNQRQRHTPDTRRTLCDVSETVKLCTLLDEDVLSPHFLLRDVKSELKQLEADNAKLRGEARAGGGGGGVTDSGNDLPPLIPEAQKRAGALQDQVQHRRRVCDREREKYATEVFAWCDAREEQLEATLGEAVGELQNQQQANALLQQKQSEQQNRVESLESLRDRETLAERALGEKFRAEKLATEDLSFSNEEVAYGIRNLQIELESLVEQESLLRRFTFEEKTQVGIFSILYS
jgi:hypothetical protein